MATATKAISATTRSTVADVFTWANGNRYEGDFRLTTKVHGRRSLRTGALANRYDGDRYEGDFRDVQCSTVTESLAPMPNEATSLRRPTSETTNGTVAESSPGPMATVGRRRLPRRTEMARSPESSPGALATVTMADFREGKRTMSRSLHLAQWQPLRPHRRLPQWKADRSRGFHACRRQPIWTRACCVGDGKQRRLTIPGALPVVVRRKRAL